MLAAEAARRRNVRHLTAAAFAPAARSTASGPARPWSSRWPYVALGLVAYVPLLWNAVGKVSADTKTYLTLDPGRLLGRAASMWDPTIGLGTVTHQTIGYLFPLGPYYWVMDRLGVPDWLTQRLWLGSILFAAGAGVLFLCRTLGWRGRGAVVASFAYLLSPYVLHYAARLSVILLPWAGVAVADRLHGARPAARAAGAGRRCSPSSR